ncbi:MAG: hypothetical protein ACK5YK_02035, partial [Pseudomonadota bacterium]
MRSLAHLKKIALLATLLLGLPVASFACTNPAGRAGDISYASNYGVMVFCDGTNWVSMAGSTSVSATDPRLGTLNPNGWCQANAGGTALNCTSAAPSGGTPGGSNGQIQFNNAGAFGGSAGLLWDNAASRLTATNLSATNLTASGAATAGTLATGGLTVSGATSITTISATIGDFTTLRVNGVDVTGGGGGGASPTNVPAFRVHRNGTAQAFPSVALTKIIYTTKDFDVFNNFNIATSRFQPTVPGRYIFTQSLFCDTYCHSGIVKNGSASDDTWGTSGNAGMYSVAVGIFDMNGTTDYV